MTMGPMDRIARLFLDTTAVTDGLDKVAKEFGAIGTQAEAATRGGLLALSNQMAGFLNNTKTGQAIWNRQFDVITQGGARATRQMQQLSGEINKLGNKNPGGALSAADTTKLNQLLAAYQRLVPLSANVQKSFLEISSSEAQTMSATDRAHYEFIKLAMDLEKMARSGTISAQSLQALNTRMAIMAPIMNQTAPVLGKVSMGLQQLQVDMQKAKLESGALGGSLSGMPKHSIETNNALMKLQSATQGMMFSMALLQGNLLGAAFGMIFLRFTELRLVAITAALTAGVMLAAAAFRAYNSMLKAANTASAALEVTGQRLSNFFQSADTGRRLVKLSSDIQVAFGTEGKETDKLVKSLELLKMANMGSAEAFVNAAAATENSLSSIGERFVEITKADADQRHELVKQFAKDFDITVKDYASNLGLLKAMNDRFKGSANAAAATQTGMVAQLTAMWERFKVSVGEVTENYIKPMITLVQTFVTGLMQGFAAARNTALANGKLVSSAEAFRAAIQRLMPVVMGLGFFLGRVLLPAILNTAHFIKTVIDTLIRWWQATKEIRDVIQGVVQWLKQMWDRVSGVVAPILEWVAAIALASLALNGLLKAGEFSIGMIEKLVGAILKVPLLIVKAVWSGIDQLLTDLGKIYDKITTINKTPVSPQGKSGQLALPTANEAEAQTLGNKVGTWIANGFAAGFSAIAGSTLATKIGEIGLVGGLTWVAAIALALAIGLAIKKGVEDPAWAASVGFSFDKAIGDALVNSQIAEENALAWVLQKLDDGLSADWPSLGDTIHNIMTTDWVAKIKSAYFDLNVTFANWDVQINRMFQADWRTIADNIWLALTGIDPDVAKWMDNFKTWTGDRWNGVFADWDLRHGKSHANLLEKLGDWNEGAGFLGSIHLRLERLAAGINGLHNPFQPLFDWLAGLIQQAKDAFAALFAVSNVQSGGGGGVPQGGGSGSGGSFQFGGVVPGPRGARVPVLAEAGEMFLGSPTFASGRPGGLGAALGGGSGNNTFVFHISDSVITSDAAIQQLTDQIMDKVSSKLGLAHRLSRHRI